MATGEDLGVSATPVASIVIPTRSRPEYLDVALASVVPQALAAGAEVVVVSDGADRATAAAARRHGADVITLDPPRGLNAARNCGVRAANSDLIVFLDDDVEAPPGWLEALLAGVEGAPDREVFGGPIRARLEGSRLRVCGREAARITTLDLGPDDNDVPMVWGANMAVRRRAFERIGEFDERLAGRGDEEEWEQRYLDHGGKVRYVAAAGVDHRRMPQDATLRALASADYHHGRNARRNDVRRHQAPSMRAELRMLAGCIWHTFRRGCGNGIVMTAHTAGRVREALSE